jgi:c-di-GMP-binding flagellar brake protein YcgR
MSNLVKQTIERRKSFRIDMENESVDLLWRDTEGQSHKVSSVCLDFSKGGMKVEHDFAILPNTKVNFRFQSEHPDSIALHAKVVRCLEMENGRFSIGFKIR